MLDILFIALEQFLQTINVDRLILIIKMFKTRI